jgi:hypothetical protein
MGRPKLATDSNSHPIQAIELSDDAVAIAVGTSTSNDAIPTDAELIRIGLDVDAYIRFGASGVTVTTTNGHFFPKGIEIFVVPIGATHVANISADGASTGNGTMASIAGTYDQGS